MCCEGLMVCAKVAKRTALSKRAPAGPTLSPITYAVSVMAVPMTLSGLSASVRVVIDERIIAKTNLNSIRGLSKSLKERKSEGQGVKRARIISGMERTEGPESSGGAEQINGAEETEGKGDERLYPPLQRTVLKARASGRPGTDPKPLFVAETCMPLRGSGSLVRLARFVNRSAFIPGCPPRWIH